MVFLKPYCYYEFETLLIMNIMRPNKHQALMALTSILLTACAADPNDPMACNETGRSIGYSAEALEQINRVTAYAPPRNLTGYENLFTRYRNLDKIYFTPSFVMVEGSMLVHLEPHHDDGFMLRSRPYDDWLFVALGEHYTHCDGEYVTCTSPMFVNEFHDQNFSHRDSYDRKKFNSILSDGRSDGMPGDDQVFFDFDSSDVKASQVTTVRRVKEFLDAFPTQRLVILGRADATGADRYNRDLSRRRAQSVVDLLVAQGVPRDRIHVSWSGSKNSGIGQEFRIAELNYERR